MAEENKNLQPVINDDSFVFVRDQGSTTKIKDEKMQTKSTTYARDAFKRFCKNKSSVVGAIIIAILMLGSIFIPIISPYKTTGTQNLELKLLNPKLFKAGTGWWDGCVSKTGVLSFNEETGEYGVNSEGNEFTKQTAIVSDFKKLEVVYYDYASHNFTGGTLRISTRDVGASDIYYRQYNGFEITADGEYTADIVMSTDESIVKETDFELAEYRIMLEVAATQKGTPTMYSVQDWSTDYPTDEEEPLQLNLSKVLSDNGLEKGNFCRLRFEIKNKAEKHQYLLFKNVLFSCADEEKAEDIKDFSIIDPNSTCLLTPADRGLWVSNGDSTVLRAEYASVRYRYDMYEHALGFTSGKVIGYQEINSYVEKGWMTIDWAKVRSNPSKADEYIEILSSRCPLTEDSEGHYITGYSKTTYAGQTIEQLTCNVQLYKYLGYKSMPKFVFGSDNNGRDLFTHCFRCLKNSLLLSICCFSICFVIGIIWGSVSGYYGGTVDLVMERITDLLAGIPSTIVLTLMLLLLGRKTVTFAFAVCLTGWIGTSSLTRTQFYRFKNRESVLAARTLGASDKRLIFKHILPNSLGTIVTSSVLAIPGFIFTEASLSFLHLGLDTGDSFGVILSENQTNLSKLPLLIFVPSIILCLLMICFNLFGNGLRDALNPTLKGGEQ